MSRLVLSVCGALLVCAALSAPAGAASLAYIGSNDNVYLTTPDGSRTVQVTADAQDGRRYRTPSQTDDGAIVTPASNNFFYVFNADGTHRTGPWLAPRKDGNSTSPISGQVTPDGGLIVYHQIHSDGPPNFNIRPRVRVMNGEIPTSDPNCFVFPCKDHYIEPRWIPGTVGYGAISLGGEQIGVLKADGTFPTWIASGGADFDSFDVSLAGNKVLFQLTADGSPQPGQFEVGELVLWQNDAAPPAGGRQLCRVPTFGNQFTQPRWSPDGTQIAWEDARGVWVSHEPRDLLHNVGTDTCGLTPRLIAPGAKDPAWGPVDVPGGGDRGGGDPGGGDPGGGDPGGVPGGGGPGNDGSVGGSGSGAGSGSGGGSGSGAGSGSGGGSGSGAVGGGTSASDTSAPAAEVRVPARQRLAQVRSRGLRATVTCDEACSAGVELLLDRAAAARLGLAPARGSSALSVTAAAARQVVVGRGSGRLARAGSATVTAKLTRAARARLRRARSLKLTVRVTATDAAGNRRIVSRRATLRR